ncbi:hypothetical protein B0H14DRAFT_2600542 [Mycena olivaceomarginata]|nr:hypothetical protein B0H14DRAFT_2600542 [Mycena olivaceomarginata]
MTVSPVGGSQLEESTWHAGSSSKVSRASPRMDTVLTEGRGSASLKNPMLQKNMPRGKASVQYINEYELYHFWLKAPGTPHQGNFQKSGRVVEEGQMHLSQETKAVVSLGGLQIDRPTIRSANFLAQPERNQPAAAIAADGDYEKSILEAQNLIDVVMAVTGIIYRVKRVEVHVCAPFTSMPNLANNAIFRNLGVYVDELLSCGVSPVLEIR